MLAGLFPCDPSARGATRARSHRWGPARSLAALSIAILVSCAGVSPARVELSPRVALRLEKLDGTPLTLGGLRGRVVLLTMITTWADAALLEVPRFAALAEQYTTEDLQVLCVVLEPSEAMVRIFSDTFALPYPLVRPHDLAAFTGKDGPLGPIQIIPTSVLLDREGRTVARVEGMWPKRVLEDAVERLVARRPSRP